MKWLRWLIVVALCIAAPASAFWQSRDSNYNISVVSAAYQGPGDIVSGAKGFWGFRAYNAAYIGSKAANICDTATGLVCSDVNIAASGYFNAVAAAALTQCATSCNVAKLYDQSGNGNDLAQVTNSKRPLLTFNAINTYACATFASASSTVLTVASLAQAAPWTMTAIVKRTANVTLRQAILSGTNGTNFSLFGFDASVNTANFFDNNISAFVSLGSQADSAFHALQAITNNTTEYLYGDGSNATAASSGTISATAGFAMGVNLTGTSRYIDGVICEGSFYASDFVAGSHTTAMNTNMHAAYGGF